MSHQARDLAASRAHAPHTSMFLRMLVRAAVLRRGRAASALFAMVVAAAVATAMLNLYVDVQAKLQREFRNYGANIILVGKGGADRLQKTEERIATGEVRAGSGPLFGSALDERIGIGLTQHRIHLIRRGRARQKIVEEAHRPQPLAEAQARAAI